MLLLRTLCCSISKEVSNERIIFFVSKISKDMKYVTQNLVKNPMLIAIFALGIVVSSYFVSVIGYSRKK